MLQQRFSATRCMSSNFTSSIGGSPRRAKNFYLLTWLTYILPILGFFFAVDFLGFANLFGLFQLLLSGLEQIARLNRYKLHRVVGGLWWCCSCDSLFLDVVRVLGGDLAKQRNWKFCNPSSLFLPFCLVFGHRYHSLHSFRQTHWIGGCRGSHTMNIDCLCPSHPLTAMALFHLSLSLPPFST